MARAVGPTVSKTILCGCGLLMFSGVAFSQQSYPYYGPRQGYPATQGSYPGSPQPYSQQPVYPPSQTYPPPQQAYPLQQDYPSQQSWQQQQPAPQATGQQLLSPEQVNNLVAPIALYPDPVLSQALAASTYPLEIVEAEQWVRQHSDLQGAQLVDAARQMNWDPSVQALVAFPDALAMLTRDVRWTTDLGNAFLAQQGDVLAAVQRLRAAAERNGRLQNTPQQVVTNEPQPAGQYGPGAIQIRPANPQVAYVPTYNPEYVWGPPAVGVYPALEYPSPALGILFGAASFVGSLFAGFLSFGGWGWGISWLTHSLFLNGLFLTHFGFGGFGGFGHGAAFAGSYSTHMAWEHNPAHRMGVPYASRAMATRFGGSYAARPGSFGSYRGEAAHSFTSAGGAYRGGSDGHSYQGGGMGFRGEESRAYAGPSQGYTRSYSSSYSGPGRSYGGSAGSYGSSAPQYSAHSFYSAPSRAPSNSFGNSFAQRGFSSGGGAVHFSEPKSSGHFSAPHSSGGGHSGGRQFGGGHSGGGHSGGSHSGGGHHK
jgi:hypothetical protein